MRGKNRRNGAGNAVGSLGGWMLLSCWLLAVAAGCGEAVGVRRVEMNKRFERMDRTALNENTPSERTLLYLRRHDVEKKWRTDPETILTELNAEVRQHPDREALFALMELSYIAARRSANRPETAAMYSLSCAVYAFSFIFDPAMGPPLDPYHPHSRAACEFYNRSFAAFAIYLRDQKIKATPVRRFPVIGGELSIVGRQSELRWDPSEFDSFFVTYEFEVQGLENVYQSFGLGVPVILIRTPRQGEEGDPEERFLPKYKQTYAATGLLKVAPFVSQASPGSQRFEAELLIFDPTDSDTFSVGNRKAALETDITTPLAYLTGTSQLPGGISGILDVASWQNIQGLHMLQPYEKGKIPVVFVHGLMSSPRTWLAMFNDLSGDPVLRKHYQFWFFMYPTGNPIMYSAAILRDSLNEVRRHFDPEGDDPAFNRMVLVGHSMGGVLSRLMIVDSGERFWDAFSDTALEEADLDPEQRKLARKVFFFEHLPYVSRVIFIAAPHRGSEWADYRVGRLGSWLVGLPVELIKSTAGLMKTIVTKPLGIGGESPTETAIRDVPTGIDGLSPKNKIYQVLDEIPVRADLPFHTIAGNTEAPDTPGGSDGIVPYSSSHLEEAQSEKIVHSGHSAHNHPLAILEVHRILLLHLQGLGLLEKSGTTAEAEGG